MTTTMTDAPYRELRYQPPDLPSAPVEPRGARRSRVPEHQQYRPHHPTSCVQLCIGELSPLDLTSGG
ncbi:hypothetical protein I553_8362 [Mycobacterium xenopi 4042]|uniref:Uncharacterized protein n=1 Tax=Mycobacterium xenopi 4042 TaxID=1299334 RepID=X8BL98_MYCXE|nr:hypothetical protein I553_8362 [Mycobacterium xenopi 4042]